MKKIISTLLLFLVTQYCFTKDITIINTTNANGGWKAKIESEGKFITNFRNMYSKNSTVIFRNLDKEKNYNIQIQSIRKIGRGTALSSSFITLRKNDQSENDTVIKIKECNFSKKYCQKIEIGKDDHEEEIAKENIYYYVE